MNEWISDRMVRAVLAFLDLAAFMAFVAAIVYIANIHLSDTMIGVILGYLGALVKDSHTYWYGTTAGSTAKDAVIAASQPTTTEVKKI